MNYPVWNLDIIGTPWIVGITAILHVFISHFAVGGGAYLYLTERKAIRENDPGIREHVKKYTKFFYYITTVFGTATGVGIWFAIGLASAPGTSTLIHAFVWFWAIEWVIFAAEIATIMVYYYTWDRISDKAHLRLAALYFIISGGTLFVINGILTFMLTPGGWLETGSIWAGFFNPTFMPSFLLRISWMIASAGLWGILVATLIKHDDLLRTKLVRYASTYAIPFLVLVPICIVWYLWALPEDVLYNMELGVTAPALGNFSFLGRALIGAILMVMLVLAFTIGVAYLFPRNATWWGTGILLGMGLITMGMSEWTREAARKPYVVYGYMWSNGMLVSEAEAMSEGFLEQARWARHSDVTGLQDADLWYAGRDMFVGQCHSCHTTTGYRGMDRFLGERDVEAIELFLDGISYGNEENAYAKYMPPLVGTKAEKQALAIFLSTLNAEAREHGGGAH